MAGADADWDILLSRGYRARAARGNFTLGQADTMRMWEEFEGRVLFMNDRGSALAGTFDERRSLPEQMAYYTVRDPETRRPLEPAETPVGRALSGETVSDGCFLIRLPGSESDTLLRTSTTPLRDSQGHVTGVIALFWHEPARSS